MAEQTTAKVQKKSWFSGLKSEMKKVVWPKKGTLVKQTIAVIIASVTVGAIITLVDYILQYGLNFIIR